MTVTRQQFQNLAAQLARDTFGDFFPKRTFTQPEVVNPVTGTVTRPAFSESVPAIREEYEARQVDGQVVQVGDFKLLTEVAQFDAINPRTDGLQVSVDGVQCRVIRAEKDAADAMWVIQVRQL
ncbi:putative structural protein [Idiomarinaceae phage Phi1M2-2]|uniref:putative structural protein n=1 Tax=Idiomarinaceae phage Phi1M2-2 TaxID=1527515 RepID=UPI0004F92620|nr:putative structural protein [Idiomarinaceae phage Phi1M2-2]AIM40771.1 putative structural protein [Idiomarinaceae phage Phi1M2-2]